MTGMCVREWWLLLLPAQPWCHPWCTQVTAHCPRGCRGCAVTAVLHSCPPCTWINATCKAIKQDLCPEWVLPAWLWQLRARVLIASLPGTLTSWGAAFLTRVLKLSSVRLYWPENALTKDAKMNSSCPDSQRHKRWETHMNRQHIFGLVYGGLACNFPHFHPNKKKSLWLL